jgi:hypothetical protein
MDLIGINLEKNPENMNGVSGTELKFILFFWDPCEDYCAYVFDFRK